MKRVFEHIYLDQDTKTQVLRDVLEYNREKKDDFVISSELKPIKGVGFTFRKIIAAAVGAAMIGTAFIIFKATTIEKTDRSGSRYENMENDYASSPTNNVSNSNDELFEKDSADEINSIYLYFEEIISSSEENIVIGASTEENSGEISYRVVVDYENIIDSDTGKTIESINEYVDESTVTIRVYYRDGIQEIYPVKVNATTVILDRNK